MSFFRRIHNKKSASKLISLLIISLFVNCTVEVIHRNDLFIAIQWIYSNSLLFLLNFIFVFSIFIFFTTLIPLKKVIIAIISYVLVLSAVISDIKVTYLGNPLLPLDLKLGNEIKNISTYSGQFLSFKVLAQIVIFTILLFSLLYFVNSKRDNYKRSLFKVSLSGVLIFFVIFYFSTIKSILDTQHISWDQIENYEKNGFLFAFALNMEEAYSVKEPADYTQDKIEQLLNDSSTNKLPSMSNIVNQDIKPNIIFIMNEAFSDPTIIKDIEFSDDPLPIFHNIQSNYTSGFLVTPVYGGGTPNTEFEVLTGNSIQFLPSGAIAYSNFIKQPIDSLASILSRQGYAATAIHTYHNWFWNRNTVYENLGFDKYISYEFFINPTYKGPYIADTELSSKIIEVISNDSNPSFVFAVSMQNHSPYNKNKYSSNTISVKDSRLSPTSNEHLESYVQGLSDVDQSLKQLVEYYENENEPTVIILFGDHLPAITNVYEELGQFGESTHNYDEYLRKYSLPFIMWSNFPLDKEELFISTSYLGAYVLDRFGLNQSPYFEFVMEESKKNPIIPQRIYWGDAGIQENDLDSYRLLQYDNLFGEGYSYNITRDSIPNSNYVLGDKSMKLSSTFPERITAGVPFNLNEGKSAMAVYGKNINKNANLYVNNKNVPSIIQDELVTFILEDHFFKKPGSLTLQLKVLDSNNIIISQSNQLSIQIDK